MIEKVCAFNMPKPRSLNSDLNECSDGGVLVLSFSIRLHLKSLLCAIASVTFVKVGAQFKTQTKPAKCARNSYGAD